MRGSAHVVRRWAAVARPEQTGAYVAFFDQHVRPALEALPGFVDAQVLARDYEERGEPLTEITVLSRWTSLAAIRAFAGDDVERAVVEPDARALLVHADERATHHRVIS